MSRASQPRDESPQDAEAWVAENEDDLEQVADMDNDASKVAKVLLEKFGGSR